MSGPCLWLGIMSETSIKNEEGGRDDTVPKSSDTRRPCEVGVRVCNNLLQSPSYISFWGVVEDYCIFTLLPHRAFFSHSFLAWYQFFIFVSHTEGGDVCM